MFLKSVVLILENRVRNRIMLSITTVGVCAINNYELLNYYRGEAYFSLKCYSVLTSLKPPYKGTAAAESYIQKLRCFFVNPRQNNPTCSCVVLSLVRKKCSSRKQDILLWSSSLLCRGFAYFVGALLSF